MQDILIKAGCYIAIIILGYVLRRRGVFGDNAFPVISALVVKITMPAAIIASSAGKPIQLACPDRGEGDLLFAELLGGLQKVYGVVGDSFKVSYQLQKKRRLGTFVLADLPRA